jgi:hypothetical protein
MGMRRRISFLLSKTLNSLKNMQIASIAAVIASALAVSAAPAAKMETAAKVVAGLAAHVVTAPIGGLAWVNSLVASNQKTNLHSTPSGFVPIAVETSREIWGTKQKNIPLKIAYERNSLVTDKTKTKVGVWADVDNFPE